MSESLSQRTTRATAEDMLRSPSLTDAQKAVVHAFLESLPAKGTDDAPTREAALPASHASASTEVPTSPAPDLMYEDLGDAYRAIHETSGGRAQDAPTRTPAPSAMFYERGFYAPIHAGHTFQPIMGGFRCDQDGEQIPIHADVPKLIAERDHYKKRYELLEELLHDAIVPKFTYKDEAHAEPPETLMTVLESGGWRAICPTCRTFDCTGGGTSRCSQEACEKATEALEAQYEKWIKMGRP